MKRVIAWALRIVCFVVIAAAAVTLIGCLMHINDEYYPEVLLGDALYRQTFAPEESVQEPQEGVQPAEQAASVLEETPEAEPTVVLTADGAAGNSGVMVTAAFGNIADSIVADLQWFVDGELVFEDTDRELTDGDTVTYSVAADVIAASTEGVGVSLTVEYDGNYLDAAVLVGTEELDAVDVTTVRTQEIIVTALRDSEIYEDQDLDESTGETMGEDTTGLLRDFGTSEDGQEVLHLQFTDGSEGWVDAEDMEITEEDCTTDADYSQTQKEEFVNSMHYDSETDYLIWVNLYTQKVNVFSGSEDDWVLEEVFSCSSGVNSSPTTTGIFAITAMEDRWDLGDTYVAPVLVFNGGQAFTSQPYDTETDEITNDTIGKPASGGGVRLLEDDIEWMAENIPMDTLVVVY